MENELLDVCLLPRAFDGSAYHIAGYPPPVIPREYQLVGVDTNLARPSVCAISSSTEAGWTFSRDFSLGGRAILDGYDNRTPGAFGSENETKGDYQISMRSRHQPARGLTSELNLFSGVVNLANLSQQKRGLSGDLNGRLRYVRGGWLTNEANGQLTGNLARTRIPGASDYTRTEDLSGNLRGTLGLYTGAPVGFNLNYNLRDSRVETPASVPSWSRMRWIQTRRTSTSGQFERIAASLIGIERW